MSDCIEKGIVSDIGDSIVKRVASSLYAGGADTVGQFPSLFIHLLTTLQTVSSLATFYLAMACYPEVLKRAQEELDRVVGQDRLPSLSDRANLPYIEALVKETFRWENVVPLSQF